MAETAVTPFKDEARGTAPVRGFVHRPTAAATDALVLTHGAGANCNAPLLVAVAHAFATTGWLVLRCDLPFRQQHPHGPPQRGSAPMDQEGLRRAVTVVKTMIAGKVFIGGHSYGGRQASMAAAADRSLADGLLLLSYPLHPPNRPAEKRTAHLGQLFTPALFVSGDGDSFGTLSEIEDAMKLIPAPARMLPVAGVGHSLLTRRNRAELPDLIVRTATEFFGDTVAAQALNT